MIAGLDGAGLMNAIDWSSTISLGSIILGALIAAGGLLVFGYGARWKAAAEANEATAQSYKEGREAFRIRIERQDDDLKECHTKINDLLHAIGEQKAVIAELEARPNLLEVNAGVRIIGAKLDLHETSAENRTVKLVDAINKLPDAVGDAVQKTVDGLLEQQRELWPPDDYRHRGGGE